MIILYTYYYRSSDSLCSKLYYNILQNKLNCTTVYEYVHYIRY